MHIHGRQNSFTEQFPCDIPGIVDVFTCRYQATHVPSRNHCVGISIHATIYIYIHLFPPHIPSILSVHACMHACARGCVCVRGGGLCITVLWHTWQYYLYFCKLMIWGYKKWSLFRNWFMILSTLIRLFFFLKEKVSVWCHHALFVCVLIWLYISFPFQLLNQFSSFHKTWYGYCAITGHPSAIILNLLKLVIITLWMWELVQWDLKWWMRIGICFCRL
jgi:hypothetical protein